MARLNAALGRATDAGLCWVNALWAGDDPAGLEGWLRTERGDAGAELEIDAVMTGEPTPADLRALGHPVVRVRHGPAEGNGEGANLTSEAAVAALMAAACAAVLRLPLSSIVITLVLVSKAGVCVTSLIVVAAVIAFVVVEGLDALRSTLERTPTTSPPAEASMSAR